MDSRTAPAQHQDGTSEPTAEASTPDRASGPQTPSPPDSPSGPSQAAKATIRWPRWGWLPYVLIAAFVGYWAATHTGAVISGATSWRAIAFGIAAGLLTLGLLVGVARLTRRGWAGQLAGLVPLVAAVAVAVLPSYITTTVDESAPEGLTAASPAAPSADPAPAEPSVAPGAESSAPTPEPPALPPPPPPAGPVEVGSAPFVGIDHQAAGVARLIQLEDGSLLVRFEQFSVEPGPDYDVYVVSGKDVTTPAGGTLLGDLKGTDGDQNYEVPSGAIAAPGAEPLTVLIWCEVFAVPVANATL